MFGSAINLKLGSIIPLGHNNFAENQFDVDAVCVDYDYDEHCASFGWMVCLCKIAAAVLGEVAVGTKK